MAGKLAAIKDSAVARSKTWIAGFKLDSWQNLLTGLGTLWDKGRWTVPRVVAFLDAETLDALFYSDPWARRMVETPVRAAFRQGYEIVASGVWVEGSPRAGSWTWHDPDPEMSKREAIDIERAMTKLNANAQLQALFVFGRLFGREAILLGADDGVTDLTQPLEPESVSEVRYLELIDRRDFWPVEWEDDPNEPGYGEPSVWVINRASGRMAKSVRVHKSRLLMAGALLTSNRKKMENEWCDASVLQPVIYELQRFNTDNLSVSNMMMDASQAVLKIHGFAEILAGEDKDTLRTRMDIIDRGRSVSRIMPIDAADEEFSYVERTFTGVKDIMEKRQQLLAGAFGWPVVLLFGREPAGLDATGESDIRAWYDEIQNERVERYEPTIVELVQLVATAMEVEHPESWGISWPSLWQESPKEKAERQKFVADTDAIYLDRGVVDPDEIANARFGGDEWSDRAPQIDFDARTKLAEMTAQKAAGEMMSEEEAYGVAPPSTEPVAEPEPSEPASQPVEKQALNGAQIASLTEKILIPAALGDIPRETAIEAILLAFPTVERSRAEAIMSTIGRGFVPASASSEPAGFAPVVDTVVKQLRADGFRIDPDIKEVPPDEWSGAMHAQSVTLPGDWTQEQAQTWLKENGYRSTVERGRQGAGGAGESEEEKNRWRARQFNPEHFREGSFRVKELEGGVQLVLGRVK